MLNQLLLTNIFFAVNVFAAFAFFAAGWIHLDSWKINRKNLSNIARAIGFFAVSISLLILSSQNSSPILTYLSGVFKIYGGLMIFISLIMSPIIKNPNSKQLAAIMLPPLGMFAVYYVLISPVIFILTSISYFVRIFKGYEKQIKKCAIAISFFTAAEILKIFYIWSDSNVVYISNILSKHGPLSILILILELASTIILLNWVWGYIRFRLNTQVFLTTLIRTLLVFLVITSSFSYILLKNIENNILDSLETSGKVVQYTIERMEFEALSNAKLISSEQNIVTGIAKDNKAEMYEIVNKYIIDQNLSFLDIVDLDGKVLVTGEIEQSNDFSLSGDPVVISAIKGSPLATVYKIEGANSPILQIRASSPIYDSDGEKIIGVVVAGFTIDNAFLDGIKEATGIEITIYGDNIRSASTILSNQGKDRLVGTKETNQKIVGDVLKNGRLWRGNEQIINSPYYTVFLPLKKYNEEVIGMISVGKPQSIISSSAQKSVETTFSISIILIAASIFPALYVSRFIEENITA